jgi:hypothetical protein
MQVLHIVSATDFHQKRFSASEIEQKADAGPLTDLQNTGALIVRMGNRDDELEAASWLRARSFYAYPEERKFAGEVKKNDEEENIPNVFLGEIGEKNLILYCLFNFPSADPPSNGR